MIANAQSKIQIVDTHESLETLINIDVAAGTSQFNRTLVILCCAQKILLTYCPYAALRFFRTPRLA